MNFKSQNWLLVAVASITIGSVSAIAEISFGKFIDSFLPDAEKISNFRRPGSITLLSTNGKIIQKLGPATREKVNPGMIPSLIKKAFIAAEDRRFYEHKGVDLWGISRAIITNFQKKEIIEGGSTITQQLARIVFLSQERSITRKIKEAALAYKLERQLSKNAILEQYLNSDFLSHHQYLA